MRNQENKGVVSKIKGLIYSVKEYWNDPAKGN